MKTKILTSLTGTFGPNAECGWWAVRWTVDGKEGHGSGLTEQEALDNAQRDAEEVG